MLDAGFHTLMVDRGRPRTRHHGLPLGGAADRAALAIANGLVGNPPDAPALEIAMLGPTLRADCRAACALFGAPFGLAIANQGRLAAGMSFTMEPGSVLKIGGTPQGCRAYFAVAGGFQTEELLGSRSSLEPIQAGTTLQCCESAIRSRALAFDSLPVPHMDGAVLLRSLLGPQVKMFLDAEQFFGVAYTVGPAGNRMGLRLLGPTIERRAGELASEAVAPGSVQVTNDGLPVILGVDGQTIGGYPKIAQVIRADLDRLAQLRPGDRIRFVRVTADEAEQAAIERRQQVDEWLARLAVTINRIE